MYIRWALLAPISLAFNLLVMLTAPIWAAWAAIGKLDRLPGLFALVHTHDDDIYGSATRVGMGDGSGMPSTAWKRFTTAVWWLWRNPGYLFKARVLGFSGVGAVVEEFVETGVFDVGGPAYRWVVMRAANGKRYFTYRRDIKLSSRRYARIFIGWQNANQHGWHIIKINIVNPFRTIQDGQNPAGKKS